MKKVSIHQPLDHYTWGAGCDGWNLLAGEALSVKQERMPPATAEQWHYHANAQQFFIYWRERQCSRLKANGSPWAHAREYILKTARNTAS